MGNSVAKEVAYAEAQEVMEKVTRKCNAFVVGVENTSVVVNVELTELKAELADIVLPFHDRPFRAEVGMLEMAKVIEDIQRHSNCHKHAIYSMLSTLNHCQNTFEDVVSSKMSLQSRDGIISDSAVSNDLRLLIEKILVDYATEVRGAGCSESLVTLRSAELERMLFKLGDSIIIQIKENIVNEIKNTAFEQIDEILCAELSDGTFSDADSARSLLQSFITVYVMTRDALEELPFLQRLQIERAQDKLSEYVEDLIRRVQMVYAYHFDDSSMKMVMNLEESDDSSDEESHSNDSEDIEDTKLEESEDGVELAVVPAATAKKAAPSKANKASVTKAAAPARKNVDKNTPQKSSIVENKKLSPIAGKRKRVPTAKAFDEEYVHPKGRRSKVASTDSTTVSSTASSTPATTRKRARK